MAKKKKDIQKPIPGHHSDPAYDWHDIEEWIRHKYGRELRDWAGKYGKKPNENVEYQDFWHLICDQCDIHNGAYFYLGLDPEDYEQEFAKEIVKILAEEFPDAPGDMYCWVSW